MKFRMKYLKVFEDFIMNEDDKKNHKSKIKIVPEEIPDETIQELPEDVESLDDDEDIQKQKEDLLTEIRDYYKKRIK